MSTIRFGFIGAGQIAYSSADAIQKHSAGEVLAVQDLNESRCSTLAEEKSIPRTYSSAGELLADPDIDAVYIAVPNKFHAPLSIQALQAGKHVVLDKPFAMNFPEALEVSEVARASGKVFFLGMNQRFLPGVQKIRHLSEQGHFGEIYHAKAVWQRRTGIPRLGTWFGSREMAGAGCLFDIGVHLLDVCLYVMDNFDAVSVSGATYSHFGRRGLGEGTWGKSEKSGIPFDVDDFASALIRFSNGASVDLHVTWACHDREPTRMGVQVFGTEAGATTHPAAVFRYPDNPEDPYEINEDPEVPLKFPHQNRFHNFIEHLLGNEPLCVTIEQALSVQKILDGILESGRTGTEVKL